MKLPQEWPAVGLTERTGADQAARLNVSPVRAAAPTA